MHATCLFVYRLFYSSIHIRKAVHNFARKVRFKNRVDEIANTGPSDLRVAKTLLNTQNIKLF